ncbi:uncharacterized protein CC84DRAFT_1204701 [Paraphaeosphaeria sporulosa]|uniref:N-acetyltransferase domain-containing protein n=1 Tax=Paraphaeosphaeria sporulosa TaxID=1460663 RepID=A0A177CJV5_9PLEO|nr:uncharacterized protein CC84DRAFT_1204701 [Paraphaeosphaeria sporulosa]OAG07110.1 hypothetical protein CC84DRAFT_1204701 [Paraphaeosphaeria sporulosa]
MASVSSMPSLDGVRLATPEDLARIATVAAAGFFHSPTFHYQRVHYAAYPDDTLLRRHEECGANLGPQGCSSYWSEYDRAIRDGTSVVLVAEDTLDETEGNDVYPALRDATAYTPGASTSGSKLVVGVASVDIKPGSSYIGMFQPPRSTDQTDGRDLPANAQRDLCEERVRAYKEATTPAKIRYLQGQMRLSTLAVHPAYWNRGHATRLVGYITRLADLDGVPLGISAVPQGAIVAARAGFEERELVRVKQACVHKETNVAEVELWVAIRRPSGTPVSGESLGDNAMSPESQ